MLLSKKKVIVIHLSALINLFWLLSSQNGDHRLWRNEEHSVSFLATRRQWSSLSWIIWHRSTMLRCMMPSFFCRVAKFVVWLHLWGKHLTRARERFQAAYLAWEIHPHGFCNFVYIYWQFSLHQRGLQKSAWQEPANTWVGSTLSNQTSKSIVPPFSPK